MEAGLDNSNNPFGVPNGANTDNILAQKNDGLLLNLTDNFKQNGTDIQSTDFFSTEKANGKRLASDFDDDDFGPETDVDALDELLSPGPKESIAKNLSDVFSLSPNNNLLSDEGVFNPFMEHQEKAALEMEKNMRKREDLEEFEDVERLAREETPTPPADAVHDVSGLVENPADSESEDEWNYFKGEDANKETISPLPEKEVADIPEEDDTMSQLNPNAAEFVPVSPTRSAPSPTCRMLINDQIVSQSPKKANDVDLNVPNHKEFENEIKSRPSEFDTNGHNEESELNTSKELMENILNGKSIDEIPEFQPISTPKKVFQNEEFHFGPNAGPFSPKLLDQSEALSTKAVYGDDTITTIETSFNESINQDLNILNKESDPMSMSFYADKGDSNPFDLNKVHELPDNIDEFLSKPDNETTLNETISDLPEHLPLGEATKTNVLNNDDAIQITDLDKHSYDDEKELESPLESEKELLTSEEPEKEKEETEKELLVAEEHEKELLTTEETDFAKTPEPTHENLLGDFCFVSNKKEEMSGLPDDVEVISPNPSPLQEATEVSDLLGKAEDSDLLGKAEDIKVATEVSDLLGELDRKQTPELSDFLKPTTPEVLPEDVEILPEEIRNKLSTPEVPVESISKSPQPELEEFARIESHNIEAVITDILERPLSSEPSKEEFSIQENVPSPIPDLLPPEPKPICRLPVELYEGLQEAASPDNVCNLPTEAALEKAASPDLGVDLLPSEPNPVSPLPTEVIETASILSDKSEKIDIPLSPEPIPQHFKLEYPTNLDLISSDCDLPQAKSPIQEEPVSPDYTEPELLQKADERFEELCKPVESPQDDVTSSIKDDLSSPVEDLSSKSPVDVVVESFVKEEVVDVHAAKDQEPEVLEKDVIPPPSDVLTEETGPVEDIVSQENEIVDVPPKALKSCICPSRLLARQEVEIPLDLKTETISPEFAEPAVVTPSEESKAEDIVPVTPDEPVQEPPTEEPKVVSEELQSEVTAVGVAAVVAAGAAITAVVSSTKTEEKKKTPCVKKPPQPKTTPNKSPALTSKTSPKLTSSASKPAASKPATTLKATASKTGTTRPSSTSAAVPKASPRPSLTKPKPQTTPISARSQPTKTVEKSPLPSSEVRSTIRSNLTVKKTVSETNGTKTTTSKPATVTRVSQNKVTTAKPPATSAPKTTIPPRSAPASSRITSTAPPKRPTTLTSKSTSGNTSPDKATSAVKSTLSKTSPKSTTNVLPKPKPTSNTTLSKPRVPLTRTVAKAPPDTEKQIKESANKITASRSASSTKPAGATSTTRTTLTSARKVESKVSSTRTTFSKTTTTTTKSTTAKKPVEPVPIKSTAIKPRATKIEKPKENGISTVVTEEITTIVNNTNTLIDSQPELVKDNSPVDNKHLNDTTQLVETNAD